MCQFRSEENICFGIGVYKKGRFTNIRKSSCIISNFCGDNGFVYIHNKNIKGDCLYQDSLHLLETGKKILERNFVFVLNECFLEMNTHHPPVRF